MITEKVSKEIGAEKVVGRQDREGVHRRHGDAVPLRVATKVFETLAAEGSTSSGSPPRRSRSPS